MKNIFTLLLVVFASLGIGLAVYGGLTLVQAGIDAVQKYYETQESTERNEWGQDTNQPRPCSVDCD